MSQKPWMVVRKQFFHPTDENWFPCYPRNCVLVRVCEAWHPDRKYVHNLLIGVWGAKDFGMYKLVKADIFNVDRKRRQLIAMAREMPHPVSGKYLWECGLRYA